MPSNTTPRVISDKARALYERVTEAERYHSVQATIYEALKANRHSDALKMQQAGQRVDVLFFADVESVRVINGEREQGLLLAEGVFEHFEQFAVGLLDGIRLNLRLARLGEQDIVFAGCLKAAAYVGAAALHDECME